MQVRRVVKNEFNERLSKGEAVRVRQHAESLINFARLVHFLFDPGKNGDIL